MFPEIYIEANRTLATADEKLPTAVMKIKVP